MITNQILKIANHDHLKNINLTLVLVENNNGNVCVSSSLFIDSDGHGYDAAWGNDYEFEEYIKQLHKLGGIDGSTLFCSAEELIKKDQLIKIIEDLTKVLIKSNNYIRN